MCPVRCIAVHAEAQHPVVTLAQCRLHEETVYVEVEIQRTVEITNISLIPTHFTWNEQVLYILRTQVAPVTQIYVHIENVCISFPMNQ